MILGDSMIKNIKGWDISKKLQNANVYVRHFSGAQVRCYLKLPLRQNPHHFVLHVCTNMSVKIDKHGVTISNIITRNDRFMAKANEVNKCFTELCFEINFSLIDHCKTLKS